MVTMHYILDEEGNPVPEHNLLKWAMWYETAERHVGEDYFGDIHISTVFLATAHVNKHTDDDRVMLYETMVFATDDILARLIEISETDDRSIIAMFTGRIDIQKRYATKEEAIKGHKAMCTFIETCLTKGLLSPLVPSRPLRDL